MSVNKVTTYDQKYRRFDLQQRERVRDREREFSQRFLSEVHPASCLMHSAAGDKAAETLNQPITSA